MSNPVYNNDYMRRLLIEAPRIRAKLENPGGSLILTGVAADTERMDDYSGQIGNGFHLDLIETEMHFRELSKEEQQALIMWATGLPAKQAAMYANAKGNVLRKRRERGVTELTEKMNERSEGADRGGTSRRFASASGNRYRRIS